MLCHLMIACVNLFLNANRLWLIGSLQLMVSGATSAHQNTITHAGRFFTQKQRTCPCPNVHSTMPSTASKPLDSLPVVFSIKSTKWLAPPGNEGWCLFCFWLALAVHLRHWEWGPLLICVTLTALMSMRMRKHNNFLIISWGFVSWIDLRTPFGVCLFPFTHWFNVLDLYSAYICIHSNRLMAFFFHFLTAN